MARSVKVQFHAYFTPELSDRIDKAADLEGIPVSHLVIKAIEQYLSIYTQEDKDGRLDGKI